MSDKWVQRFSSEKTGVQSAASGLQHSTGSFSSKLGMGWAIPKRSIHTKSIKQKNFLNKLFDDGEETGNKISAESALQKMKNDFEPADFLPLKTIKSYFSTRARKLKEGRANLGEIIPETVEAVEPDSAATDSSSEDEEEEEVIDSESREKVTTDILSKLECLPDLQKDEWIAVDMGSVWYPAQFESYDAEQEELYVNFLHRSPSNTRWFVWPQLEIDGEEDKSWISEDRVFYRLAKPKEGRRQTLLFDDVEDVEKKFEEHRNT